MPKTIYKFPLPIEDRPELWMPRGARVLSVQEQHGKLCLWAEIEEGAPPEERKFYIFGTGHRVIGGPMRFLATVQMSGGKLVWHIYEGMDRYDGTD
jgi:hypothetical protein